MNLSLLGFTLHTLGEIMVAYTAIRVHYRVRKEHRIDENVFVTMKKEQYIGIAGIILILAGFALQLQGRL